MLRSWSNFNPLIKILNSTSSRLRFGLIILGSFNPLFSGLFPLFLASLELDSAYLSRHISDVMECQSGIFVCSFSLHQPYISLINNKKRIYKNNFIENNKTNDKRVCKSRTYDDFKLTYNIYDSLYVNAFVMV